MQLKISSITNLTDARYFSAIGAQYLGFSFDVLNENNISIAKAKEIVGWLHEPVIIGEFGVHQTKEEIQFVAEEMPLNEIQIPFSHAQKEELDFDKFLVLDDWSLDISHWSSDYFVIKIKHQLLNEISRKARNDDAGISENLNSLQQFIKNNKVFIETDFTKENILPIIENLNPFGIQITCRKEEKAGLSFVDEYAEIVELIGF
ncbi:MAG: hypothetical protein U0U67_07120 [Chitinophagales bacterium]